MLTESKFQNLLVHQAGCYTMARPMPTLLLLLTLYIVGPCIDAFITPLSCTKRVISHDHKGLSMVKFNGDEWVAETPEETGEAGYPAVNTLMRHGPKPFLTRVFQPNDYEQAVLKFMAGDKCDRRTAQGNMDKYLANPNDWAYNRMEEEKRGVTYDYVTIKPKEVVLVLVWTVIIGLYVGRGIYSYIYDVPYVRILPSYALRVISQTYCNSKNDFMRNL